MFYSSHARKRELGDDARAVYEPTSLERALVGAEKRAGVEHKPYRGMHGFRRGVAGDVLTGTRDAALALQYIGDVDLTMASQYLKRRSERLQEAADVVDARPDPSPNRPAAPARWSPDSEVPSDAELCFLKDR